MEFRGSAPLKIASGSNTGYIIINEAPHSTFYIGFAVAKVLVPSIQADNVGDGTMRDDEVGVADVVITKYKATLEGLGWLARNAKNKAIIGFHWQTQICKFFGHKYSVILRS